MLELAADRRYEFVTSIPCLDEFARVLRDDFGVPDDDVDLAVRYLITDASVVSGETAVPEVGLRDPDDLPVLRCAVEARADYLVTGDKDLLVLGTVRGVRIVRPAEFLRLFGGSPSP